MLVSLITKKEYITITLPKWKEGCFYLKEFEAEGTGGLPQFTGDRTQISLSDIGTDEVRRILEGTDLNTLTPLEAMNLLSELQRKAKA